MGFPPDSLLSHRVTTCPGVLLLHRPAWRKEPIPIFPSESQPIHDHTSEVNNDRHTRRDQASRLSGRGQESLVALSPIAPGLPLGCADRATSGVSNTLARSGEKPLVNRRGSSLTPERQMWFYESCRTAMFIARPSPPYLSLRGSDMGNCASSGLVATLDIRLR